MLKGTSSNRSYGTVEKVRDFDKDVKLSINKLSIDYPLSQWRAQQRLLLFSVGHHDLSL